MTPQIAVETVLSREWLHFGNPRWLQRRAAREAEFDKLMTEASVRRRWQLLRWAQEWDLGSQDLDHELEKRHRGAPPKKKRFVIRQDTIANPKIRARFARDHHLDSLDDEYWFWTPDDVRGRRRLVRSQMRSVWWRELKDSWEGELKDLGNRLELTLESWKLSEGFRRFGDTLDFETRVTRLVDDVGKAQPRLRRLMSGARSGEHRRIYRQARKLVGELRSRAEETEAEIWQDIRLFESPPGAMSPEMFIEALDAKVDPWSQGTPAGDKKKKRSASKKKASKKKATRKKSTKKPTQSGTKKAAKTGKKGIELRPGMIQGLNQARITVLGGNQIFTVQDLLDSKNFHNLLQGAGPKAEMRMRNKARKILEQAD